MLTAHGHVWLRLLSSLGLLASAWTLGAGAVHAQQLNVSPDGQQFQNQSAATQRDFVGTFGAACAPQEWLWQHTLALNPDDFNASPATDGQAFGDQDDDVQRAFVAWFGPQAAVQWVAEHNAVVAHKVLQSNAAPVPCPPAAGPVAVEVIGTRHLADAVEAAKSGDFNAAADLFAAVKVIWNTAKTRVAGQSPATAQSVQAALDQVAALEGASNASDKVLPALQNLLKVVTSANASLAAGRPAAATASAPASMATPPTIDAGNLGEAVDWANKGDYARMRREFGQFQDDWAGVRDAWQAARPTTASAIDAAIAQLKSLVGDASQSPPRSQYQPVILSLQKLVQDANASAGH